MSGTHRIALRTAQTILAERCPSLARVAPQLAELAVRPPREGAQKGPDIVRNWGFFSSDELTKNRGKLLMLDLDLGRYCSLRCPTCFRKSNAVDDDNPSDLSYDALLEVLSEAAQNGLRVVKICGAGEPTENHRLLPFLHHMKSIGVGVGLFTKGHVLGNDSAAQRFHSKHGIKSAKDLAAALWDLNASVFLGWHSFRPEIQDAMVGTQGYTRIRNKALLNLVEAGFADASPPRLALVNAPVLANTVGEAFEIYVFARSLGVYPVTAMLMTSGKQLTSSAVSLIDPTPCQKWELWRRIYRWNIEHGIQTLSQLARTGISSMPGAHPCNQIAAGLYLTGSGAIVSCPGSNRVLGNVRFESLGVIWERHFRSSAMVGCTNCGCPEKVGTTIPTDLFGMMKPGLDPISLMRWLRETPQS